MYRPQFAYPLPPAPCEDQRFAYSFDSTNLPALTGTLAAGARTGRIPLKLDKDADFFMRALTSQGTVSFRLEDPHGNALSDSENATQSSNYEFQNEFSNPAGAGVVALDSGAGGLFAPAGGNFLLYLYNGTAATINLTTQAFTLHGVKRYAQEVCP